MLLPPANEVCKGYVFTGVCLSTGGGGLCPEGRLCPGGSLSRGSLSKGGLCQHVRAVRILLECILVDFLFLFS